MAVQLSPYRTEWPKGYERLAERLQRAFGRLALRADHAGSTAVSGLPAKDVIDAQVVVASLDDGGELIEAFTRIGFGPRPGKWNRREHIPEGWIGQRSEWTKPVFGPDPDERPSSMHVRACGRANERCALLVRDYLRADAEAPDLSAYGRIKDPPTDVLMRAADGCAERVGWEQYQ